MNEEVAPSLFTRGFVALGVADLAYFISVGIAIYCLPLYATGPIGSDEAGAGLAFGAFGVTALVCRPIAGRLSDVHGRIPLLVLGALLAAVGMLALPYVDSLAGVVAVRLVQGIAEAAFFVAGFALLADLSPPERMGEALSYNSLGLYLGITAGPPLGEVVVETWGFDEAWWLAGGLAVSAALIVRWVPEVPGTGEEGHGKLIHRPGIPVSLGFFASLAAISGFLAFASLWSTQVGLDNTSLALAVYGLVIVFCRVAFAKVPDRLPSLPLATGSLLLIAAGLALLVAWQTPTGMIAGVVVMAVGVTFSTPAFFAAVFATATPSERGAAAGTASAFIDIGLGFGPIALGLVARAHDLSWAFAVGCGFALAGAAWTTLLAVRARSAPPVVPSA
ncbi:MFS transporter [Nocardioides stalactiti]|uniref:MFS transporter n=1 Tax=Nocardioides stalactiti TaxID=2755356 RepID=UPI001600E8CE|nr:MFS transporter [Nocardioides stalactiti]